MRGLCPDVNTPELAIGRCIAAAIAFVGEDALDRFPMSACMPGMMVAKA
jgi:hypothetical protein